MAGWQDDPVVAGGGKAPVPQAGASSAPAATWQGDAVQGAPPGPDDVLARARAAAGPGASEGEIRELAARMRPPPAAPPAPVRGHGEQFLRNLGLNVQGMSKELSDTVGSVLPSGATKALEDFTTGRNTASAIPPLVPETKPERFQEGAGRGVTQALEFYAGGEALAPLRGTAAATVPQRVGQVMAQSPGLQIGSGMASGGTTEATGNPWLGLAAGLGIPSGVAMARKLVQPTVSSLTDFGRQLMMDTARTRYQIPTSAGEQTGSRFLRGVEDQFGQLPTTSGPQAIVERAKQDAFNRGVLGHSDTGGTSAQPRVLNQRFADEGSTIGDIVARNPLDAHAPLGPPPAPGAPPPPTLATQLMTLGNDARVNAIDGGPQIVNQIHELVQHIQPNGTIPGTFVREWDTNIRNLAESVSARYPDVARRLRNLQDTVRDAHAQGMPQQDAADLAEARRNYAVLKTTEDAVGGSGKAAAMGDVPPVQLQGAVDRATTLGYARGGSDLNDLGRIGQLMRPPADSGTPIRTMITALLQGSLGGVGLGGGYALGGLPGAALAGVATPLILPRLAQAAYNSDIGQRYLVQGIPALHQLLPQVRGAMGGQMAERLMDAARQQRQQ